MHRAPGFPEIYRQHADAVFRFLFGGHPGLIVGMVVTALAFWVRYYRFSRRFC